MYAKSSKILHCLVLTVVCLTVVSGTTQADDDIKDIAIKFKDATSFYLLAQKYAIAGGTTRDFQEALKWYTEAAKLGHTKSELQLGRLYFEGLGTDVNYDMAARWLVNPANNGYNAAQYMLGMIHLKGTSRIKKDESKAFTWLLKAAEDYNIDASYQVGRMYYYGIGTSKDAEKAKKYLQFAQEQEVPQATELLGQIAQDESSSQQPAQAAKLKSAAELLIESADQGNVNSQYQLADAYLHGTAGIEKSTRDALQWFNKAAENGHKQAQYILGSFYYDGRVINRNLDKARYWLSKAAQNGVQDAKVLIAQMDNIKDRPAQKKSESSSSTNDLFLTAAEKGDKEAQFKVGLMYLYGENGFPKDSQKALTWLQEAANQNHTSAQFQTGMMYYRPDAEDNQAAKSWLAKAAENGHRDAQYFLGTIYNQQQDYDKAVKWLDVAYQNNHIEALELLVEIYMSGKLQNPDKQRVLDWLEKASANGFRDAQYELGTQYLVHDEVANHEMKAFAWIEKAARKDHTAAKYKLAMMYQQGIGAPKQYTKSARWFKEAAEAGYAEAQYELAELYSQGLGLPKSKTKAEQWYKAAAEQGHMKAKMRLGAGSRY